MPTRKGKTPYDPGDPQKAALYNWEDEWWGWNISVLTLAECRHIVRAACDAYRLEAPKVIQHNTRSMSFSQGDVISLQGHGPKRLGGRAGGKNFATAVHEVAHYITDKVYGLDTKEHGWQFMKVYLDLLVRAKIAPPEAIYYSAAARGLKWNKS